MEALYFKLYEKYSKLKSTKENQIDQIHQEQEVKFVEFVSAAETLIEHLEAENNRFSKTIDELRNEVISLRSEKEQFTDFQERLVEEKQKNRQLSIEMERLRNLQQEGTCFSNRSDQHEEQHLNSSRRSLTVDHGQANESPMIMTRKRARLAKYTNPSPNSRSVSDVRVSERRELSADKSNQDVSKTECCQGTGGNGDPCSCLFQRLVESLIGMKVSVGDQSEGKCLRAVHQSSGYSFSLTWVNKSAPDEKELLYKVVSLGTFASAAPEWMREVIVFSVNMCPVFFERVYHVIKHGL